MKRVKHCHSTSLSVWAVQLNFKSLMRCMCLLCVDGEYDTRKERESRDGEMVDSTHPTVGILSTSSYSCTTCSSIEHQMHQEEETAKRERERWRCTFFFFSSLRKIVPMKEATLLCIPPLPLSTPCDFIFFPFFLLSSFHVAHESSKYLYIAHSKYAYLSCKCVFIGIISQRLQSLEDFSPLFSRVRLDKWMTSGHTPVH